MSKSSLCKIVRTYIEQAKDGSTGYYNQARPAPVNAFLPKKTQVTVKPPTNNSKAGGSVTHTEPRNALRKAKSPAETPVLQGGSRTASLNASTMLQTSQSKPKMMHQGKEIIKPVNRNHLTTMEDRAKDRGRPSVTRKQIDKAEP